MSAYATVDEFAVYGLPSASWSDIVDADVETLIEARSAIVDGLIHARGYEAPLTVWGKDLTVLICRLVAWDLLVHLRGVNPADPAHAALALQADKAETALREVVKGYRNLTGTTPARAETGTARVFSSSSSTGSRGW